MLFNTMLAASQQLPQADEALRELIDQVKAKTDLREFLRPKLGGHREFDGYWGANCLSPDHPDTKASLLVFPDQCRCQACAFRADILDFYKMEHPDVPIRAAITNLLTDPTLQFAGQVAKVLRGLDQDLAVRYHLRLVEHPEALAGLEGFGFSREAIRHFQLGYNKLPVRQADNTFAEHWRYSVPVFDASGHLKQIIYRKAEDEDTGPKTVMEYKAGAGWLFNEGVLKDAQYAVLASGWGDVVVLWQYGIPAVSSISGDGTLKDDWTDALGHVRRLYVVPDADAAGEKLVTRLQSKLPWARHIKLPYELGTKKDVRDYHLEGHGKDDFLRLLRQADMESSWKVLRRGK